MLETFLAVSALITLIILAVRANKRVVLPNPVLVQRAGEYSAILAPRLNTAQPLIEGIAHQMGPRLDPEKNSATQYFEVRDKHTTAHGHEFYLLAITLRDGMLYFQAVAPSSAAENNDSNFKTLHDTAARTLANIPDTGSYHAALDSRIVEAINAAAQKQSISIKTLTPSPDVGSTITA